MAYGTGFDPNSPASPKWASAKGVQPITESPINAARAWARADETGIFDNAHRASLTTTDPTQSRSLGGANAARSKIGGTRATARPSITYAGSTGAPPEEAERRGDAGPTAYAQGVAPNFYADKPYYDQPFGTTGQVVTNLASLLTLVRRDPEAEPEAPEPKELAPPSDGGSLDIPKRGGPPAVPGGGSPAVPTEVLEGEIVDEIGTTYTPIGQGYIDVDSWETSGDLPRGRTPGVDRRAQRAIGTPTPELEAGDPDAGPNPRLGPPEGFAMGGGTSVTPADPMGRTISRRGRGVYGTRPMGEVNNAQNNQVQSAADSYEFGNTYFGQSNRPVGRKGTGRASAMAEYNARMNQNQGQILGFDWGDV